MKCVGNVMACRRNLSQGYQKGNRSNRRRQGLRIRSFTEDLPRDVEWENHGRS